MLNFYFSQDKLFLYPPQRNRVREFRVIENCNCKLNCKGHGMRTTWRGIEILSVLCAFDNEQIAFDF